MFSGLCESPVTFWALSVWMKEMHEGSIGLRDIIDLEAAHLEHANAPEAGFDPDEESPSNFEAECRIGDGGKRSQSHDRSSAEIDDAVANHVTARTRRNFRQICAFRTIAAD